MKKRKVALILTAAIGATMINPVTAQSAVDNGWEKSGGEWYYYSSGQKCTGWVNDNGTWYYLESNGAMKTGWLNNGGNWYYLKSSGAMAAGWIQDNNKWYYLNNDGSMKTGWLKYNDKWYFLKADGSMAIYWEKVGQKLYYLGTDGAMKTGWFKVYESSLDRDLWYYADEDGVMKDGWLQYNNKWYYMNSYSGMRRNDMVDGYYLNKDGVWDKSYDNKISIAVNEPEYDIEDNRIYVSIVNLTDKSCEHSNDFIIEKYKDNQWVKVSKDKEDSQIETNDAAAKSLDGVRIYLSSFKEKPAAGKYRIGIKINSTYVYDEFKFTGETYENPCVMTLDKTSYPVGTGSIPYTITNTTDRKYEYDPSQWVEQFADGEWKSLPSRMTDVEQVILELEGKSSFRDSVSFYYNVEGELKAGKYRIARFIGNQICYGEFELTGEKEPYIVMEAEQPVYTKREDKKVKFTVKNNTDENLIYHTYAFRIDKWNEVNNEWEYVSLKGKDLDFTDYNIKAGNTESCEILLDDIEDCAPGKYRMVKYLGKYTGIAEFEIDN